MVGLIPLGRSWALVAVLVLSMTCTRSAPIPTPSPDIGIPLVRLSEEGPFSGDQVDLVAGRTVADVHSQLVALATHPGYNECRATPNLPRCWPAFKESRDGIFIAVSSRTCPLTLHVTGDSAVIARTAACREPAGVCCANIAQSHFSLYFASRPSVPGGVLWIAPPDVSGARATNSRLPVDLRGPATAPVAYGDLQAAVSSVYQDLKYRPLQSGGLSLSGVVPREWAPGADYCQLGGAVGSSPVNGYFLRYTGILGGPSPGDIVEARFVAGAVKYCAPFTG